VEKILKNQNIILYKELTYMLGNINRVKINVM